MPRIMNCIATLGRAAVLAAISLPLALSTLPANAADYVARPPAQIGDAGVCSSQHVLRSIVSKFSYQVRHVPNLRQVGITAVSDIYLKRFEPKVNPSEIARTYCSATAVLSDGQQHAVWYLVEEGQGFASLGRNVEFCVDGFDRWYVYNASCSVLR
ncbi:phage portal protein [Paraburkholderia aspalathi]|nr:phage portal protein [Paraburkholderia aspalathi]